MRYLVLILLCAYCIASCRSTGKISRSKAAGLDTITDMNLLESKKRAIYQNKKGEQFIMHYEPDPGDSAEQKKDTLPLAVTRYRKTVGVAAERIVVTLKPVNKRCDSEYFDGSYRKEQKLSESHSSLQQYATITSLKNTLQADAFMATIITTSSAPRTAEEDRYVRVKTAYLYCYSKQTDEDFHVIIGNTKTASATTKYFNVEISGLPPDASPAFADIQAARSSFLAIADTHLCSSGYYFFETPLKIELKGSLFFDKEHFGDDIGPASARPTSAWEIHPVTYLRFK